MPMQAMSMQKTPTPKSPHEILSSHYNTLGSVKENTLKTLKKTQDNAYFYKSRFNNNIKNAQQEVNKIHKIRTTILSNLDRSNQSVNSLQKQINNQLNKANGKTTRKNRRSAYNKKYNEKLEQLKKERMNELATIEPPKNKSWWNGGARRTRRASKASSRK